MNIIAEGASSFFIRRAVREMQIFVLHGFAQGDRLQIIANARHALRPGVEFIILDYNESHPMQSLAFDSQTPHGN